jgi:hypothetical protein
MSTYLGENWPDGSGQVVKTLPSWVDFTGSLGGVLGTNRFHFGKGGNNGPSLVQVVFSSKVEKIGVTVLVTTLKCACACLDNRNKASKSP